MDSTLAVVGLVSAVTASAFTYAVVQIGHLREQLREAREQRNAEAAGRIRAESDLANVSRAKNALYRESLEDQRARQLNAAYDAATGIEYMLQALRTLSPEMARKVRGEDGQ